MRSITWSTRFGTGNRASHELMMRRIEIRRQFYAHRNRDERTHTLDETLRGLGVVTDLRLARDVGTGKVDFDQIGRRPVDHLRDVRKIVFAQTGYTGNHRLAELF